jgi:hypothetical protein
VDVPVDQPVAKKRQPDRPVLGRADLYAQDLPIALGVDPGGDEGMRADGTTVLAHFEHQRVGGHERVGTSVEWASAKRLDLLVELGGHH